jgi:hypothetical protein
MEHQLQYRNQVISNCCGAQIHENTDECSACLEHCSFVIENPTAFHKWLIKTGDGHINKMVELMRFEIVENQNQMVFELCEMVDMGENVFSSSTLTRVAEMLLETRHTTSRMD